MRCFLVEKEVSGKIVHGIRDVPDDQLPAGEVLVRVHYSSLNFKDALAATAHPGVVKQLPHVPGIDAAGVVVESGAPSVAVGSEVIVTSYDLGAGRWGAWGELIRVPAAWVVPLPAGMSLRESMVLGTAGFTAAMSAQALQLHGLTPDSGEIVVTGGTGGVGSLAIKLLAKLGFRVTAVSGKPERHAWLTALGAANIVGREAVDDPSDRPLLAPRFAGAVDTVGGRTLTTILRSLHPRGCAAACGLVGGTELPLSIYPFLLRGITLAGIDSAWCPYTERVQLWHLLAGRWKLDGLDDITTTVRLEDLPEWIDRILTGKVAGRVLVDLT